MKSVSTIASWALAMIVCSSTCTSAVTAADYARAERFLPFNTAPLVLNVPRDVTWTADGTAGYSILTARGEQTVSINPARRSRTIGGPAARAAAADPTFAPSPDGRYLAFIRDDNLLTPENGTHEVSLAPSGRYFIDSYSTPDTPQVTVLRDADGRLLESLEEADITALAATGWQPPLLISVKARDGVTELHGLMFKPTNFDPTQHYPIVNWIYPGPMVGSVNLWTDKQQWKFVPARADAQSLAELGFVVVAIDGMGTAMRSRKFHDTYYGNMGDNTLPDQVAAMKELAQHYPWIDLQRAGIYGHSGGGYAAAAAMLRYPDFFQVGIAESGNHDQAGYTDDWGEKFQGLLQRHPDGSSNYDAQANQNFAAGLKGHLLLVHGTADDNVPSNLTLLLADALIKVNKDFDLILLPNQRHTYTGESGAYMTRRRWDYFVRNLQGATPSAGYRIVPPADPNAPVP